MEQGQRDCEGLGQQGWEELGQQGWEGGATGCLRVDRRGQVGLEFQVFGQLDFLLFLCLQSFGSW